MIVVSNTSPLCYLIIIGYETILPRLFGQIIIPQAVCDELENPHTPKVVQQWMASPPNWLVIQKISDKTDSNLVHLHIGEQEAIILAGLIDSDLLIVDDKAARKMAQLYNLRYTGLLGILSEAARKGFLDLPDALTKLRDTTFRITPSILKLVLDRHYKK